MITREVLWRERWHLAALLLAAMSLLAQHAASPQRPDPWAADRKQLAQELDRDARQWSPEAVKAALDQSPGLAWRVALFTWGGLGVLLAGCILLFRAWRRRRRGQAWFQAPPGSVPDVPWGIWDAVKVFAWLLCGTQLLVFMVAAVFRLGQWPSPDRYVAATLQTMLMDGVALLAVALLIGRRFRIAPRTLGLQAQAIAARVLVGLRTYVLWLPIFVATIVVVMLVSRWWSLSPEPQAVVVMLMQETRTRWLLVLMAMVAVIGPVAEEVVFRGVVYAAFRRRLGVRWGLVGSAALFAALHLDPIALGPIFLMGLLLGWLYERTGSLIPSMTVHFVHNSVMLCVALTARDMMRAVAAAS